MAEYKWYTVRIPVEVGGALDKRINAYCRDAGLAGCQETVASQMALTGIVDHMHRNLEFSERVLNMYPDRK